MALADNWQQIGLVAVVIALIVAGLFLLNSNRATGAAVDSSVYAYSLWLLMTAVVIIALVFFIGYRKKGSQVVHLELDEPSYPQYK